MTTIKNSAPPHESSQIHASPMMQINIEWLLGSSELAWIAALRTQTIEQNLVRLSTYLLKRLGSTLA